MIERKKKRTARIGIFAVAHATYWGQFEGLYDNIMGYHQEFCEMTEKNDAIQAALPGPSIAMC